MNKVIVCLGATLALIGGAASAATQHQQHARVVEQARVPEPGGAEIIGLMKAGNSLETVSCRDFSMLDESFRPRAITYAMTRGRKGKPVATETIRGVERITPVVLADCRARPGDHFTAAVDRAVMKKS